MLCSCTSVLREAKRMQPHSMLLFILIAAAFLQFRTVRVEHTAATLTYSKRPFQHLIRRIIS